MMMLLFKIKIKNKVVSFFVYSLSSFLLLYFLLGFLGVQESVLSILRNYLELVFDRGEQLVILEPNNDYKNIDTKFFLHRADIFNDIRYHTFNIKYLGYIPFLFFASLVLASPVSWPRKLKGFSLGIVILLIYFALVSSTMVHDMVFTLKEMANADYSQFLHDVNQSIYNTLIVDGFQWNALVSIFIWFLTTIRLSDFKTEEKIKK